MTNYEFSEHDNVIIGRLAKWMLLFGIIILIGALTDAIPPIVEMINLGVTASRITDLFLGLVSLSFALAMILPTDNLRRIVKTEGNDLAELMTALKEFALYLGIALLLVVIAVPILILNTIAFAGG